MKIASIPLDIACADPTENLLAIEGKLRSLDPDTDIVVLPELFTTGFISDNEQIKATAETNGGHTVATIRLWAAHFNVAICGSFLACINDHFYNRGFFIEPSGEEKFCDKAHLFSLSEESETLSRGNERIPTIRFRGWNISFIICYDLRFPVWCRNVDLSYDIMIVPANWPTARKSAWETLIKARAIENQAYYVACNRSGIDDYGEYSPEMTFSSDYKGNSISTLKNGIIYTTLNKEKLEEFRRKFPVWKDNDRFEII